ncbi:uncharacterized protein FA14DRAFT_186329 [Meira miltonrushii]|uniref:Uncharacterized protein n=1 Tax=Meira miltonrushii TaxID=1280837 RepID=A0A316V1T0_9BASI|nr:uncharacterized protein FA14DRAFT_186329 [Meira miltonrushii]PWN31496.1 hypothetical protein FA14DRAFT_186329 [Meira miltonrushii]
MYYHNAINHINLLSVKDINKENFLVTLTGIHNQAYTPQNVKSGFRQARIWLYNL